MDGEGGFGEGEAVAERADGVGDDFVGLHVGFVDAFLVFPLQEVAPGVSDVDGVAVVGGLVDDEAYVEVICRLGKGVVELRKC